MRDNSHYSGFIYVGDVRFTIYRWDLGRVHPLEEDINTLKILPIVNWCIYATTLNTYEDTRVWDPRILKMARLL